jgi:hypothetical protein
MESDFSAEVFTDPRIYPTFDSDTEVSVELATGTHKQSPALTVTGVTQPIETPLPDKGQPFIARLDRDIQLDHTFKIETIGRDARNKVHLTGYGLERSLHQTSITASYDRAPAGQVIRDAADEANVPRLDSAFPAPENVSDDRQDVKRLLRARREEDTRVTADYSQVPAINVINEVAQSQGWEWRCGSSRGGGTLLWYGNQEAASGVPRDAEENIERGAEGIEGVDALNTAPRTYELRWILPDEVTDPRAQAYPFDVIRVVGKPTTYSASGPSRSVTEPLMAQIPVGTDDSDAADDENGSGNGGTGPRMHTYRSSAITSQAQANRVAESLWRAFERDRHSGPVKVVGDPRPEPLDRVVYPDWAGGGNRLVLSALHEISQDNGYITTLELGGQPPGLSDMPEIDENPPAIPSEP